MKIIYNLVNSRCLPAVARNGAMKVIDSGKDLIIYFYIDTNVNSPQGSSQT